jgi:hypothetical protein
MKITRTFHNARACFRERSHLFAAPRPCGTALKLGAPVLVLGLAMSGSAVAGPAPAPKKFASTGGEQIYTVPKGVTWIAATVGGAPGYDTTTNSTGAVGDNNDGWEVTGELAVTPGERFYVEVGQAGSASGAATFGGGGAGGSGALSPGASGGGASDVRTCSARAKSCPGHGGSLGSRLIVGAGGGGSGGSAEPTSGTGDFVNSLGASSCKQGAQLSSCLTHAVKGGTAIDGDAAYGGNGTQTPGFVAASGGSVGGGAGGDIPSSDLGTVGNTKCLMTGGGTGATGQLGQGARGASGGSNGGGGGGGGFFGGGGGGNGRTGTGSCTEPIAGHGGGGGSGSSFIGSALENGEFTAHGGSSGGVTTAVVTFQPLIRLSTPMNGATFRQGQHVKASFVCDYASGTPAANCAGTESTAGSSSTTSVASGAAIDTSTPGRHRFTVTNASASGPSEVATTITYTVVAKH